MTAPTLPTLALQLDLAWEDRDRNLDQIETALDHARPGPKTLVVLPEMTASGFSMNTQSVCESLSGPSITRLSELAAQRRLRILTGLAIRGDEGIAKNLAILLDEQGTISGAYQKNQPFSFGGEHEHYQAGEDIAIFEIDGAKVAPFICYDLRFPELFRRAVQKGAEVFAVIANWPEKRARHWSTLLRARAIENQAAVIGVNRCGEDPSHQYSGDSAILDAMGDSLAEAENEPVALHATIDLEALRTWRQRFPALKDMKS